MLPTRALRLVALATVLGGCSDALTAVTPLRNALPLNVQVTSTAGIPLDGLPRAAIVGTQGGVNVTLGVIGTCAMEAQVRAEYAGSRVDVWVKRVANALADCAPAQVGYEYDVLAFGLGAGSYDVRVIDQVGDQAPRVVGSATVSVLPAI